jgi:hypothetical protein
MEASGRNAEKQSFMDWFNSDELIALRQAWRKAELQQRAEDDAWWDSLSYDQRAQAFRQICKLMHRAEVQDKGTYRWAIYDIFNLEYGDGLDHYMELHNLISCGLDAQRRGHGRKDDEASHDDNTASS